MFDTFVSVTLLRDAVFPLYYEYQLECCALLINISEICMPVFILSYIMVGYIFPHTYIVVWWSAKREGINFLLDNHFVSICAPPPLQILLPPRGDVLDTLSQMSNMSTLVSLLKKSGLAESLQSQGPFTFLAPSNKVCSGAQESLSYELSIIINYDHIENTFMHTIK